jgi:hypothetical protein
MIFRHGFTQLKLYFIVGQPEESEADVQGILDLAARARGVMLEEASRSGVIGSIHLGTSVLVPKPYTPWQRFPMEPEAVLKRKIALLQRGVARMPNVSIGSVSVRQAVWQTYLSKAGSDAADAIEAAAAGEPLASVLRRFAGRIRPEVFEPQEGELRWHFLRTAEPHGPVLTGLGPLPGPVGSAEPLPRLAAAV